jgi:putative colanic acid biosynthesis UDP-glucose lipid carrier transferase
MADGGYVTTVTCAGSGLPSDAGSATPVPISRSARSPLKRLVDVVVAAMALIFFAPILGLAAIAIKCDSKGPVLFRQRRTGLDGNLFAIYKLRTMSVMEDGATLSHASKADARITRVGALLRKTSIDELPQLLNVLEGSMSLVGPRPHALGHDNHYGALIPTYSQRFRAKPGLTGLAQISGHRGEIHATEDMAARITVDNAYIDDWSIMKDVVILLRTAPAMFYDPQAY